MIVRRKFVIRLRDAAGLRVSETYRLKVEHLHSGRFQIRIVQSKGKKDRSSLLSPRMIEELRAYCRRSSPENLITRGAHVVRLVETSRLEV